MTPCGLVGTHRRLGITYRLHLLSPLGKILKIVSEIRAPELSLYVSHIDISACHAIWHKLSIYQSFIKLRNNQHTGLSDPWIQKWEAEGTLHCKGDVDEIRGVV